jgi:preprotein translocase subunit SecD
VLNFSKINVLIIYLLFFSISIFSLFNFQNENNELIEKKINLGLDLQGGSYLLLEINSDSLIEEKIQSKVIPIKKLLKDNSINYNDFKINSQSLSLKLDNIEKFDLLFNSRKDNMVNPYIDNYRSYELEFKKINNN